MSTCFVIQPFDAGPFDKRYEDVFVPAILGADLEPYRVDRDPAATIPIDEIERGIRRADICLVDISAPNPNVWFELISYRTESARDFSELREQVTARLKAALG